MFSLSPWIFATENCNLRCPYCFEGHVNKNMSKEVWSATSEHFIQLVQDHVIRRTHWRISGGEPFMVFDTWREFPLYMKKVMRRQINIQLSKDTIKNIKQHIINTNLILILIHPYMNYL